MLVFSISVLHWGNAGGQDVTFDRGAVFDEVWHLVNKDFFDPQFNGIDWERSRDLFRPQALAVASHDEFALVIARMLAELRTSHTGYFSARNPKKFQLLGIFNHLASDDRLDLLEFEDVGMDTEVLGNRVFIRSVYDGFSAAKAGLKFGDEIVSVNGKPFVPFDSFVGWSGRTIQMEIRRQVDGPSEILEIGVEKMNGRTMFEFALDASVRVIETTQGQRVGYVHIWSYAGSKYHDQLKNHILFGHLKDCDALVLDLRDGWGGANLDYLNLFREPIAQTRSQGRAGSAANYSGVWGKPVALLINERTTSGKELFAYGFKKLRLGPVVGCRTAGAVVGGRPTLLSNGDILYLAVTNIWIDDKCLEGTGVTPTVTMQRPLPYANGADPQLEQAIIEVARSP
jgi:carboxyl-terminal processing protease